MGFKEWAFGPSAEQKKKADLEARLASHEQWLASLQMHTGPKSIRRDYGDPEDARIIDRLTGEIAALKDELKKLESANQ